MNTLNIIILCVGVAVLLLGCTQGGAKSTESGPSGPQNGAQAGTSGDSQAAFGELDSFAAADTAVVDPDPGADFSFDATGLQ